MGFFSKWSKKVTKRIKYSAVDPKNFQEVWSFTTSRFSLYSLILVVLLFFGIGAVFLSGFFYSGSGANDKSIERDRLEEQAKRIQRLTEHERKQEQLISVYQKVLLGEVPLDGNLDSLAKEIEVDFESIDAEPTKSEQRISKEVREDMRTTNKSESVIPYFTAPAKGVISQKFEGAKHPGVDVVTEENYTIKACLSGTVIYTGYSRDDGHIILLDHGNGYVSVYKHAKKSLKKIGTRVQLGDPIGIVGNSGANTTGPHLHFELWYDQVAVNPEEYLNFKK